MKLFNFLASVALMSSFMTASAQKFYVDDFVVKAGETTTVNIYLDPEGLELTNATICFTAPSGFTLSNAKYADGLYSSASTESCAIASTKLKVTYILQGAADIPTTKCLYGTVDLTAEATASDTEMKLSSMAYKVIGGTNTKLPNGTVVCNVLKDITINTCGYNTFSICAPVTVSGATVMGTSVDGDKLVLSGDGTTVPANTGVILKGTPGATVSFTAAAEASAVSSVLTPYVMGGTVAENSVYALNPEVAEFAVFTGTEIPAQKAILKMSLLSGRIRIADETNGIESVQSEKNIGITYNLQGQQTHSQKGYVIENGKKVIKL